MSDEAPAPVEAAPVEAAPAEAPAAAPAPAEEAPPAAAPAAEAPPAAAAVAPAEEPASPVAAAVPAEPARSPSASVGARASVTGGSLGGGGFTCTICSKVSFPAETVMFETRPFHAECFRCKTCNKKMDGGGQAAQYEGQIYCRQCFEREGFHLKQRSVKWTPKTSTGTSAAASRFGGGGTKCTVCGKTSFAGETVQFEMKPYHNTCFKCTECSKDLKASETGGFEGKLYCTRCFEKNNFHRKQAEVKWAPKTSASATPSRFGGGGTPCTSCNLTVYSSEAVSYDQKVYHVKCLACSECKKECKMSEVAKYENVLYCQRCFEKNGLHLKQAQVKFAPKASSGSAAASRFGGGGAKCVVCSKTVYPAETVQYEGKPYHTKCFACSRCSKELAISAAEYNSGHIYCKKCFMEQGLHLARTTPHRGGAAAAAAPAGAEAAAAPAGSP